MPPAILSAPWATPGPSLGHPWALRTAGMQQQGRGPRSLGHRGVGQEAWVPAQNQSLASEAGPWSRPKRQVPWSGPKRCAVFQPKGPGHVEIQPRCASSLLAVHSQSN